MLQMSPVDELAYTTVRIETLSPQGRGSGTGFIAGFFDNGPLTQPVLVTNKHVVSDASEGFIRFHLADAAGNPIKGGQYAYHILDFKNAFVGHPDPDIDLCVMPLGSILQSMQAAGNPAFIKTIPKAACPSTSQWNEFLSIESVTMIGYPSGLWDSTNNRPLFRRGITATGLSFDYENKREFLIDIATFPGSSGSPVFILDLGMYVDKIGNTNLGNSRIQFVGVVHSMMRRQEFGEVLPVPIPTQMGAVAQYDMALHLGVAVKSTAVWEIEADYAARFPMPTP